MSDDKVTVRLKIDEEEWKEIKRMAIERGRPVQEFAEDLMKLGSQKLADFTDSHGFVKISRPKLSDDIIFRSLEEYDTAIEQIDPRIKYSWAEDEEIKIGFLYQGVLHWILIPGNFPSLQEYRQAVGEGFEKYTFPQYEQIKELGYDTKTEYDKARGEYKLADFTKIHEMGYKNHLDYDKDAGELDIDEWKKHKAYGFKNFKEVEEAEKFGYIRSYGGGYRSMDVKDFRKAKKLGFENFDEYSDAKEDGFDSPSEWKEFRNSEFETREEFLRGKELGTEDPTTVKVYEFIASFPPGTPISISKIEEETEVYEDELEEICKKEPLKNLGNYISKAGNFVRGDKAKYIYRCVIIDGSNVAYGNDDNKPKIDRIKIVMDKVKEISGLPTHTYVSASLRHTIDKPEELEKLIKKKIVIQNPAKVDNDEFIIQAALEKGGYIVTKDQFKDWMESNPDKANEIDKRRAPFNFHDDETVHFGGALSAVKNPRKKGKS